ncbi:putative NBS-LRR resistance protein, partial [Trifolium pratense]
MTSLQIVDILGCPNARLPPNSFQILINLQSLLIAASPMLEKRCQKRTGEDWQTIAYVPEL